MNNSQLRTALLSFLPPTALTPLVQPASRLDLSLVALMSTVLATATHIVRTQTRPSQQTYNDVYKPNPRSTLPTGITINNNTSNSKARCNTDVAFDMSPNPESSIGNGGHK
ncbi:hypothetical protein PHYBLDRAFT_142748 [Phycomyces blakesleeanus NRRL 1555(-)]|uniref:Uncharacterized protein n=1 Tax=Phycomyces blakesleeanus (strain ATCC 8743b / DSM 1359 / FGSC 10004 / NBRC 33097 / NRRL 1555) TaxID=763407 RepID=A0A162TL78_PHYB8|nr:hypothetical protein PHYBLDRAFT_149227 [Phycomyces blakesleeanus NRRL 1555(-)]XP_018293787.1 hypothetical protein PHYBLDRAFT_142748 [Phycomyces blakesleeanus NRRL 1555(-)]OAD69442.1 hypothetical protein PHYBLDRAFT_149227 [Phycomyces blakesleeanus NRRL 1555(-)]OAD75747.1 hypothetical protein PHYBLDRAFT_142748 [Phycomyces blakesleeanus NRRL 1555(-)]|eukprot:XP_018287482.1 hypothetical protein PHYBLDRAFT_149227 [Phycomyces blakesleeanus NRRL 1555(-)]